MTEMQASPEMPSMGEYAAPAPPQRLFSGRFLAAALILLVAAGGLNFAVRHLELHFKKEPVPMRQSFGAAIPQVIGNWVQIARDDVLDDDLKLALGTDEYLFCFYVDVSKFGLDPVDFQKRHVEGKSYAEQKKSLNEYQGRNPAAVLSLGLTYYTGKADTVAHIPERCYVAEGLEPTNPTTETWNLGNGQELPVRHITFEGDSRRPQNVAYTFHVNGRYEAHSLSVRHDLQNLFARYGYYAKIELNCITRDARGADQAWASMRQFLAEALPEVEKALPEWGLYQSR